MEGIILRKGKEIITRRLFIYFLLSLCLFIAIGQLEHYINVPYDRTGAVKMRRIIDAMLFATPVLFCRKRRILLPYLLLLNLYLLSIIWYFRTYVTIMPLSSYLMFSNLRGLGGSVWHSIHLKDWLIVLPSLCFVFFYIYIYRNLKSVIAPCTSVIIVFFIGVLASIPYWPNKRPSYGQPLHRFSIIGPAAFKEYGIINYWVYQIKLQRSVSNEEKEWAYAFIDELESRQHFSNCNSTENSRKNLILILVESFQSWTVGMKHEGIEITPYMNRYVNTQGTVYFPKVLSQVKDGRSSDAQLIINTGFLPLNVGAASSLCVGNEFLSLTKALKTKGYTSVSFICDGEDFWNQGATSIAYGFDKLYDKMQGSAAFKDADEKLFEQGLLHLKDMKQPFYAQLVTYSSHMPYTEPTIVDSPLLKEDFKDNEVKNYLIAIQAVDKRIARFIDGLKKEGLFENSIIVITGDHEQMTYNRYEGREQLVAEDCFVPLIILNSPLLSMHTDEVIGQEDIYPSLLNMLGCCDYSFKGVGESVFGDSISNYAVFRTGIATGGENVPKFTKQYRKNCWKLSDILLRMDYFASH